MRAFSQGCVALTGVEAISNGVRVFKQPEAKNAQITTAAMGVILGSIFLGITYLANVYHIVPKKDESVVAMRQAARSLGGTAQPRKRNP